MIRITQEEFDKQYLDPLTDYIFNNIELIEEEAIHNFAIGLGLSSIRDLFRTLLLDKNAADEEMPISSGNPFRTYYIELCMDKKVQSPAFFDETNEEIFRTLQQLSVLFSLESSGDTNKIKSFLHAIQNSADFEDPIIDQAFTRKVELLLDKFSD